MHIGAHCRTSLMSVCFFFKEAAFCCDDSTPDMPSASAYGSTIGASVDVGSAWNTSTLSMEESSTLSCNSSSEESNKEESAGVKEGSCPPSSPSSSSSSKE